jgi:WD40 repeat protein
VGVTYARRAQDLVVRVFDLASGAERVIPLVPPGEAFNGYMWSALNVAFTPDGHLLAGGPEGVRRFDPDTGASEWLWRAATRADPTLRLAPDGRTAVLVLVPWDNKGVQPHRLVALDMATKKTRDIATHGQRLTSAAISPSGEVLVTGDDLGIVRAGPIAGGEPHLLMGHAGAVAALAVSPDGKWIASAAGSEIRLWPMPDVSKPPLHTLPHDELLAKLRALTNVRVVEDAAAPTGYRLDLDPFPGWKDVATW